MSIMQTKRCQGSTTGGREGEQRLDESGGQMMRIPHLHPRPVGFFGLIDGPLPGLDDAKVVQVIVIRGG